MKQQTTAACICTARAFWQAHVIDFPTGHPEYVHSYGCVHIVPVCGTAVWLVSVACILFILWLDELGLVAVESTAHSVVAVESTEHIVVATKHQARRCDGAEH